MRTVVDFYSLLYTYYGGYGVTVNTEVCGAFDSGSIPDSRPEYNKSPTFVGLLL